jgi:outer membrane lipoprotein-sorting protein
MKNLTAAAAVLLLSCPALAQSGPEILQKVDQAMNNFSDGTFESKLLVKEPGGQAREYGFITYQKVPDKRLVRFSSPGDVKGMGVLVENKDVMYVFLPGFQKVRRVGTHVQNQNFMGSDFSYDDMSQTVFSHSYDCKLVSQDDKAWTLELTPKRDIIKEPEFVKLVMVVEKRSNQPTKIEYYDASGKKQKTQERTNYQLFGGIHYNPEKIIIIDHRRNDHTSEIDMLGVKLNQGLKDDLFSQRSLIRGN